MKLRCTGLARAISKMGVCSRSRAFELIRSGKVKVNAQFSRDPEYPVQLDQDKIEIEGVPVKSAAKIYLMMNKPRGIVTTACDEKGRKTVYAVLPPGLPFVGPVGRLDKATEGLLLFTNDTAWAARITAPQTHLAKTYQVQVKGNLGPSQLQSMRAGVRTAEGDVLCALEARVIREGRRNAWIEIILDEGKNRHIRRMLSVLNVEVLRLLRIAIGPLLLGSLSKGSCRELGHQEVKALDAAMKKAELS